MVGSSGVRINGSEAGNVQIIQNKWLVHVVRNDAHLSFCDFPLSSAPVQVKQGLCNIKSRESVNPFADLHQFAVIAGEAL